MKKFFTFLCAALLTVAASAQVTATISPSTKNVFTPSEYEYVSVTYGDTLDLSAAVATVAYGSASTTVPVDSTTTLQALFDIDAAITSLGVSDGGVFSVSVSGVSGASSASASYKYYATLPEPTASVTAGSTLSSKTSSVTFTFSQSVACPYIEYTSGSVVNTDSLGTSLVTSVTANIEESYWSSSAADITVSLVGVTDAAGYVYPPYDATYYYAETANYLGVYPSTSTYTYQDVYDNVWYVYFKFDKEVVAPEDGTPAIVAFCSADGTEIETMDVDPFDVFVEYAPDSLWQCYAVGVAIPEVPSTASNYAYAYVTLQGFTYGGNLIDQPYEEYQASLASSAKFVGGVSSINNVAAKNRNATNVYSIQGSLVKNNASNLNSLPKGVYIIGGKKVVIR